MVNENTSLVERLCQANNPRKFIDWEGHSGYYVAACRASAEDVPGLIEVVRSWSDPDAATYWDDLPEMDEDYADLLPVTAWRTLADLRADAAVQPLVDLLIDSDGEDEEYDEWLSEELPHVFGKIGEPAVEPLLRLAKDRCATEWVRSAAARGLGNIADYHASTRDRIVKYLTDLMVSAGGDGVDFNTTLLVELVELRAVEAAEPIEQAFAANLIDIGMMGDWETVRQELGVPGLGLKMPEHPHNSIGDLRRSMGIGIFSSRAIFVDGEINATAEREYYDRAHGAFSTSTEGRQVIARFGDLLWSQALLEYGLQFRGDSVEELTLGGVKEFVFEHVPRNVSTEADSAPAIIDELSLFWKFLERVYALPKAKSIIEWLNMNGLAERLRSDLADQSKYGMAKSFVMLGNNAGYDMTSQADVDEFIATYNESLQLDDLPTASAQVVRDQEHVGRNDPCPCQSGKKFKKCCGGRT